MRGAVLLGDDDMPSAINIVPFDDNFNARSLYIVTSKTMKSKVRIQTSLNCSSDCSNLMFAGSWFHAAVPATQKALSSNFDVRMHRNSKLCSCCLPLQSWRPRSCMLGGGRLTHNRFRSPTIADLKTRRSKTFGETPFPRSSRPLE